MRPSVSSMTLGVILPSPTVVRSKDDLGTRSSSNSLPTELHLDLETFACNDSWDNSSLAPHDECTENEVIKAEARGRSSRKTSSLRFQKGSIEMAEVKLCYSSEKEGEFQDQSDTSRQTQSRCENKAEKREKKTSVVHFEDDVFFDDYSSCAHKPNLVRKQSENSPGILRRKAFYIDDDADVSSVLPNVNQEKKRESVKRKTSVRFKDEMASKALENKQDTSCFTFKDCPDKETDPVMNSYFEGSKEDAENCGDNKNTINNKDVKETSPDHSNSPCLSRKRKMSVWSLKSSDEPEQVDQSSIYS